MLTGLMQPMTDANELWGTVAIAMIMKDVPIISMRTIWKSSDYYDDSDDNGDDGGADAADDGDDDAEGADAAGDGCEGAMGNGSICYDYERCIDSNYDEDDGEE